MNRRISVSVNNMGKDKKSIAEQLKGISDSDIRGLHEAMKNLGACWEGPAWDAFQNELDRSIEEMEDVFRFFDQYLRKLEEAGKSYVKCETDNRNRLRQVRI